MNSYLGYIHDSYAFSFSHVGQPQKLEHCGGWAIVRSIPQTPYFDAMGCYPLFACMDWSSIHKDLFDLKSTIISFACVTDPFGSFDHLYLKEHFQIVKPFKTHFIAELNQDIESFAPKNHRRFARKALREMSFEISENPSQYLSAWVTLYENLKKRHCICDLRAFSTPCFCKQLQIPGMIMVIAREGDVIVGATLVLIQKDVAYAHLTAYSDRGYQIHASYGIFWSLLQYLSDKKIKRVDLGASAGVTPNPDDGLTRFKLGFSNQTSVVYFCGCVLNQDLYTNICLQKQTTATDYFPAYRCGEFK